MRPQRRVVPMPHKETQTQIFESLYLCNQMVYIFNNSNLDKLV